MFINLGVEALFKAISSILVERKDKIEKDRTLRKKHSVMLGPPKGDVTDGKESKARSGCC
jgi:hypothetical protein